MFDDPCLKWPEVISMTSTTAEKTIDVLRQLSQDLDSCHKPQLSATEFKEFCSNNGISYKLLIVTYSIIQMIKLKGLYKYICKSVVTKDIESVMDM